MENGRGRTELRAPAEIYAHTPNAAGEWHTLTDHLRSVARLAAEFGAPFGFGDAAWWAGLWHDIGKASCVFQNYLHTAHSDGNEIARERYPNRDHKTPGAVLAAKHKLDPVAMAILGHHSGIPALSDVKKLLTDARRSSGFDALKRDGLGQQFINGDALMQLEPAAAETQAIRERIASVANEYKDIPVGRRSVEMLTRFITSCLVDADYLDTARHFSPDREHLRNSRTLGEVLENFEMNTLELFQDAEQTPLNQARTRWRDHAVKRARTSPTGIYRLSGRTGVGKTVGGFAAAAAHAQATGKNRIVIAVPYMAVTDQTARSLRPLCGGDGSLLEHQSGIEPQNETPWNRLAAENWDAPVIVTTIVQLFESLFSNRPSSLRKVHRLANSVIVLDEAQTIPFEFLDPILDGLRWLVEHADATVVLQTATQPGFEHVEAWRGETPTDWGDIDLGDVFDRVRWTHQTTPVDVSKLAQSIAADRQSLCIFNTVGDAQRVAKSIGPSALCLTTMQSRKHRSAVLVEVSRRLAAGEDCTLIATQLVEAGVDLDFPVVRRAIGPLTSLAQAAGRCNRNGLLDSPGRAISFRLVDGGLPPGSYAQGTSVTSGMLERFPDLNPESEVSIRQWYQEVLGGTYPLVQTDLSAVNVSRKLLDFQKVAKDFKLIQETRQVIVFWGDTDSGWLTGLVEQMRDDAPVTIPEMRRVSAHTVALHPERFETGIRRGVIEELPNGLGVWRGQYTDALGIDLDTLDPKRGPQKATTHMGERDPDQPK